MKKNYLKYLYIVLEKHIIHDILFHLENIFKNINDITNSIFIL